MRITVDETEQKLIASAREIAKLQQKRRALLAKVAELDAEIAKAKHEIRQLVPADSDEAVLATVN